MALAVVAVLSVKAIVRESVALVKAMMMGKLLLTNQGHSVLHLLESACRTTCQARRCRNRSQYFSREFGARRYLLDLQVVGQRVMAVEPVQGTAALVVVDTLVARQRAVVLAVVDTPVMVQPQVVVVMACHISHRT